MIGWHEPGRRLSLETASAGRNGGCPHPVIANAADGADGIPAGLAHRNDPVSSSTFTTKRNLDA
jgi:hypothetical protein